MKAVPKAIVFDLGKVLVDFDYALAARRIAARCSRPAEPLEFFRIHAALLQRYELGLLSTAQFYEQICAVSGFAGTQPEFAEAFSDIFTEIQPMIELHAELRRKKFAAFIFSNTNDLAVRHIRSRFAFFTDFDGYILSYEHGALKPDAKLYEVVERQTGCRGPELLYLDDRPENVAAGAARGWRAVLHESPHRTRAALGQLGVLEPA